MISGSDMMETGAAGRVSLLTETRRQLRHFNLRVKKGLGQHFLVDRAVVGRIVSASRLTLTDVVIEVGPGLGVLTRELVRRAGWVVAIELDDRLAVILKETMVGFNNLTIVNEDILRIEPKVLLEELREQFPPEIGNPFNYKVVANLPYYITSPVMRHFLEAQAKPQTMVVMVQKEVAREITAKPGRLSLMGVSVQLYGEPAIVHHISPRSFFPMPEVDSSVLMVEVYDHPAVTPEDRDGFFRLVRAGFSSPRKQIANSLSQGLELPKAEVSTLLEKVGVLSQRRAETLTLDEWLHLWRVYANSFCTG
ncbi:16S rRNA (adenine(1518)-N(6)/adenine(1519)-N(6))-dimethyltransferase RsmA [Chloroflexota bacterium]